MILRNLLYILQSENYSFPRFLRFVYAHPMWWKLERRQHIVWTAKTRALWMICSLIFGSAVAIASLIFGWMVGVFVAVIVVLLLPFLVGLTLLVLSPFDWILKQKQIVRARQIIERSGIRVVGITGSFGKTSTKEILAAILLKRFPVIKTPENINTDIGIANFIISHADELSEGKFFVVEMGAHRRGEIAAIARMVRPGWSILTGINEAHLERFGSLENIISGKYELPQATKKLVVLNGDDPNVEENRKRSSTTKTVSVSQSEATGVAASEDFRGWTFEWHGTRFETVLLARHNITLILLCATLARALGVSLGDIRDAVREIRPVAHRLEPIRNEVTGVMIIDDSYNGNVAGIRSGLEVLNRAKGRRVVLTPGLVELGSETVRIHREMGEWYADKVDLVLLIRSRVTPYIIEGMEKCGFTEYTVYNTTEEAHRDLGNVLRRDDTIIFQNDLTDNYF